MLAGMSNSGLASANTTLRPEQPAEQETSGSMGPSSDPRFGDWPNLTEAPSGPYRDNLKPIIDPIIEVRCGNGQWVYAQYVDIDMSDDPTYRSYLSAPAWEIADCYEWWGNYDRDDIDLRVDGVVQPSLNRIWRWSWNPPELEDLYWSSSAVAAIKTTWDHPDLVWGVDAGSEYWAPREDWWVGAQVSRAGKATLVDGRITEILPTFRNWNVYPEVDACPFGFGNCDWDLIFEASTSENLLGAGIYSSQGDFVGVVDGNYDLDNPRLWHVLGKPALCMSIVNCSTNPEDIWVEYQQIPPVITSVTASGSGAKVTWNKAREFGREQQGGVYRVQAYPGGESCYADPGDNYCTIGGLEEGVTYRFRVYATGTFSNSRSELSSAVTVQPAGPAPPRGGGVQL
jgi:hypothetical protein